MNVRRNKQWQNPYGYCFLVSMREARTVRNLPSTKWLFCNFALHRRAISFQRMSTIVMLPMSTVIKILILLLKF